MFAPSFATEKFRSLHMFLCTTFNVRYDILFHLSLNNTNCLLILCSSERNIRIVTAKQMEGPVPMFVLLHIDISCISLLPFPISSQV
jgi:hypothetical protein